ncbi:hypothetical protein SAMN05421751_102177 [Jhaorihella thermophila]|uniref:Uncharacterized protein n=2 Tax=Jhaorihella thermophila TaxID=488547 RepID=A0A1H5TAZ2_9RHOB|nr:hypothetical protein SAMN05421751_102177 [Jhaorihella thermophila]
MDMFGVVLWSDRKDNKAVIWCEDHGDLAFYRPCCEEAGVSLDTGDWVQFDLTTERDMRLAHNPRLVAEGAYAGIADVLGRGEGDTTDTTTTHGRDGVAEVIPFRPVRSRTKRGASSAHPMLA